MMYVENGKVVIENEYIAGFLDARGYMGNEFEHVLESMCRAMDSDVKSSTDTMLRAVSDELKKVYGAIVDVVREPRDYSEQMKTLVDDVKVSNSLSMSEIEKKILAHDKLPLIHEKMASIDARISSYDRLYDKLSKIEDMVSLSRSATKKGQDGERDIIDMLSEKLPSRNGYSVESVRGVVNNCDIVVKCEGYENIHIDVKNYEAGGKIRTNVVEKFRCDLIGLNVSGIMVSLWSGIVSKSSVEIEQLPNGKYAVYLSNTGMNVDMVTEFIYLLHTLERYSARDGIQMHPDTLSKIRDIVLDGVRKIGDIRTHLTASISIINDLNISTINTLLMNSIEVKDSEVIDSDTCPLCSKKFSTKQKCRSHFASRVCQRGT